jgi:hypothetical protein
MLVVVRGGEGGAAVRGMASGLGGVQGDVQGLLFDVQESLSDSRSSMGVSLGLCGQGRSGDLSELYSRLDQ